MSEAIIYDTDLARAETAFDVPFEVSRILSRHGVDHKIVGVHGQVFDTAYRIDLTPPWEVWRDESQACWRICQSDVDAKPSNKTAL